MRNLRVLVFSATFGAGHIRAAEALIDTIIMANPDAEIAHLDCWAIINQKFNSLIADIYIEMIKHTPKLWGKFYYGTASIPADSIIQRLFNNAGQHKYLQHIRSFQPDIIICTYPTVAGVLAQLRLKKVLTTPLVAVVTDYAVHNQWIHSGVDLYIVGYRDICEGFISRGIDPKRIKVTGIPVNQNFERHMDRYQVRTNLGLLPHNPTFLLMGGAYGVLSDLKALCKTLANSELPSQLIVVCGQDDNLYESLDDIVAQARNPVLRFGFVHNVDELMSAADIIITKAGGLTVSEALTKRLPIVVFKPIPGQETENALFLEKIGAGRTAHNQEELENILFYLLKHPEDMEIMRQSAANALPGRAAEQAARYILELAGEAGHEVKAG